MGRVVVVSKKERIDIPKTVLEMMANIAGYSIFAVTLVLTVFTWDSLPERVPVHFNASGDADRYGTAFELLMLPLIGIVVGITMEALERHPEIHNYPIRLSDSNRREFYLNSRKILNLTKNMVFIIFSIVILEMLSVAINGTSLIGGWMLPAILVLGLWPMVYGLLERRKII